MQDNKFQDNFQEMNPFFSIIIPLFNAEQYIKKCLDSCLNQTFKNFEVIIIDDCSYDQSIQIAKQYTKDQRFKLFCNPKNLGTFHARLEGIKRAKGKYCLFLDSDDFFAPHACKRIAEVLHSSCLIDMLHFRVFNFPKTYMHFSPKIIQGGGLHAFEKIRNALNLGNAFQSLYGKALKTTYLKQMIPLFSFITHPLRFMEDGLMILALSLEMQNYYAINEKLYFYQHNPHSITRLLSSASFYQKQEDLSHLFIALDELKKLYPMHAKLIEDYKNKLASASVLEARFYSQKEFQASLCMLKNAKIQDKHCLLSSTYLSSCFSSLRYFYRWQTLARIAFYIFSCGRVKK